MSKGLDVAQVYECPEETRGKINSAILRFVWMGKRVVGPHDFGRSSGGLEVSVRAEEGSASSAYAISRWIALVVMQRKRHPHLLTTRRNSQTSIGPK